MSDDDPRQAAYACQRRAVTDSIRAQVEARTRRAVEELEALGINPEDVREVALFFRQRHPQAELDLGGERTAQGALKV